MSVKLKFTVGAITKTLSSATGPLVLRDAVCPGLIIKRTAGGKTWFALERRIQGTLRKQVLWQWQESANIEAARSKVNELTLAYRAGNDPRRDAKVSAAERRTAAEWLALYFANRTLKPASERQMSQAIRLLNLGGTPLLPFAVDDARQLYAAQKQDVNPATAVKRMSFARILWTWASQGTPHENSANPFRVATKGLSRHAPKTRHVPLDKTAVFVSALRQDASVGSRLIECLFFTGCRLEELRSLTWSEVQGDWIVLPPERTKTKITFRRPLPSQVMRIIELQRKLYGDQQYVFPNLTRTAPVAGFRNICAVAGGAAAGHPISPHDLRRTFISMGHALGVSPEYVRKLVGHAVTDVHAGYFQSDDATLMAAAKTVANSLESGLQGI